MIHLSRKPFPIFEWKISNKMEFESDEEFMDSWLNTLNDFTVEDEPHTELASIVKKYVHFRMICKIAYS